MCLGKASWPYIEIILANIQLIHPNQSVGGFAQENGLVMYDGGLCSLPFKLSGSQTLQKNQIVFCIDIRIEELARKSPTAVDFRIKNDPGCRWIIIFLNNDKNLINFLVIFWTKTLQFYQERATSNKFDS